MTDFHPSNNAQDRFRAKETPNKYLRRAGMVLTNPDF
jgi:hypothetical protein